MPHVINHDAVVFNERVFAASPREVFTAFQRPELLARWWGPNGFTNTFQEFDFTLGGRWIFAMHGPDGVSHANESIFREIEPDRVIVVEHTVKPWFRLAVTLTPHGEGTHLSWVQEFESAEAAIPMRRLGETFNEQNLDRLQALLASEGA